MGKILVWISGADPQILENCHRLPKTERIKLVGFGTLILIPATIVLVSMSYAVSTISNNPLIFIAAGFVWSLIVLVIDRFLVSTFYRSSIKKRNTVISNVMLFICRLIFAGFVGIVVSHPFMLFYFDQSIKQKISEKKQEAIEHINIKSGNEKNKINTGIITSFCHTRACACL